MTDIIWHNEKRKVADLLPADYNPRKLSPKSGADLRDSITKFGEAEPVCINTGARKDTLIGGHQRVKIYADLEREEIDVRVPSRELTLEEEKELNPRLNRNVGEWDWEALNAFDKDMLLMAGFDIKDIKKLMGQNNIREDARVKLSERFLIPPFSVLDSRQGYWQDRKRAWSDLIQGELSETREGKGLETDAQYYVNKSKTEKFLGRTLTREEFEDHYTTEMLNEGISIFDPVLTEIMYLWFCQKGGKILDPFMGGQTRPFVALELGYKYTGVDIRPEQVTANETACKEFEGGKLFAGDSKNIDTIVPEKDFDLVFTCPPYYDLEVYSKDDMSALGTYEEFLVQYKEVFKKCVEKLKDNRFLVIVIGEIRNKKTGEYRNFVGDNIRIFNELGLKYYNEIILTTSVGSLPMRAPRQFNQSRKIGKTHQNILTFWKGGAENLFKQEHALLATHQNILTFFKGDLDAIQGNFGEVSRPEDITKLL
jgi:DNA modification methylase